MPIDTIAVIGSGIMGRGIAHAAAVSGFRTILHDVSADALERALTTIRRDLDEGIARGKLTAADAAAALKRLEPEPELGAAAGEADFVIEVSVGRPDGDGHCRFEVKIDGALAVAGVARGRRDA